MKLLFSIFASYLFISQIIYADENYTKEDLGKSLTAVGAIREGNKEQTIPKWLGGIKKSVPTNESPPYIDDKVLFTINANNAQRYKYQLSAGQLAMLQQYPDYKLPVYPTRRSASYPERIYDLSTANASTAKLTDNGNGVSGAIGGVPFAVPKNGLEAIWNHVLRYRGDSGQRFIAQAAVTSGGSYTLVRMEDEFLFYYGREGITEDKLENKIFKYRQKITAPARQTGRILLAHESLNTAKESRSVWIYNPGQRRVRRAPNIAYDSPANGTDSLRTVDQFDMFNGAPDKYNWKLVERKEMFVPYNAYKLQSNNVKNDDIIKPLHINQDLTRYELHRVWVVEATLKTNKRHIYTKRTFYLDEDSWQIVAVDQYDNNGNLWRVSEAHSINYKHIPATFATLELHYDLQSQRYLAFGLENTNKKSSNKNTSRGPSFFTPSALRRAGRR